VAKLNGETFPTVLEAWEALLETGQGYSDGFFAMMKPDQGINISVTFLKPNKAQVAF